MEADHLEDLLAEMHQGTKGTPVYHNSIQIQRNQQAPSKLFVILE
jgi:hypothetical protein